MKRRLTAEEKKSLLDKFTKQLDELTDCEVNFSETIKMQDKVNIYYTPDAYSKTVRLVMAHSGEIAWHCLVRKVEDGYEVYDVLAYPQTVGPASVHVKMGRKFGDGKPKDPKKYYTDWYNEVVLEMPEEDERNLCGQCHSHVNMGTTPSSVDINQQKEELELKGKSGYYLFQIWNKKLEVNTFLYDLDNGVLYEKDDVNIVIEEDDLIKQSREMLVQPEPEPKPVATATPSYSTFNWNDKYQSYLNDDIPFYNANVFQYLITVETDGEMADFIVEADNVQQAKRAFTNWAIDNMELIAAVFDKENLDFTQYKINTPIYSSGSDDPDVPYEEILEYDYESF